MTIRAVLQNGLIHPLDPLPSNWVEGQELLIDQPDSAGAESQVSEWEKDLETAASEVSADEHLRFEKALDAIERESKEAIRREWGLL